MAECLRVLAALSEDMSLIPSTQSSSQQPVTLATGDLEPSSGSLWAPSSLLKHTAAIALCPVILVLRIISNKSMSIHLLKTMFIPFAYLKCELEKLDEQISIQL